jgi:8-oxo-dGTP diphosphatase
LEGETTTQKFNPGDSMLMPPSTATAAVAIIESTLPEKSFLLLRRASHPDDPWSGHFSFPGGRKEQQDSSILETCIRETREETGILLSPVSLVKTLSLEPAGRNYTTPLWVQPYLFKLKRQPLLELEQEEIQSACWLPAARFQNKELHSQVEMVPGSLFPVLPLEDYYLWGFTYRLLESILTPFANQK